MNCISQENWRREMRARTEKAASEGVLVVPGGPGPRESREKPLMTTGDA